MLRNILSADPAPSMRGVRLAAIAAAMVVLVSEVHAQTAQTDDMLVIMTGTDTVAVERVRRTPTRLDGELLLKTQKIRISYAARLVGVGAGRLARQ
jgi:hypothetical protein